MKNSLSTPSIENLKKIGAAMYELTNLDFYIYLVPNYYAAGGNKNFFVAYYSQYNNLKNYLKEKNYNVDYYLNNLIN